MGRRYPPDLARLVLDQWPAHAPLTVRPQALSEALEACFAASMMLEEGRQVTFRLLLSGPDELPESGEPVTGVWRLRLVQTRPCTPHELMRLSPAAPFERALIGACEVDGQLRIWGLMQSGAAWLAPSWGGRGSGAGRWTEAPIVHVTAPGRVAVRSGGELVAGLERGELVTRTMDVFESRWLSALFAGTRDDLRRVRPGIDDSLVRTASQHMIRRVISLVRARGHGALVLFLPVDGGSPAAPLPSSLRVKYAFAVDEPSRRYRSLMLALMAKLTQLHETRDDVGALGWRQFEASDDPDLGRIEENIFEMSEVLAALTAVDGAVVVDKRFRLIGFGTEVSAELPAPRRVCRSLDLEGTRVEADLAESVGTRHRAAYRFLQHHPEALALVISHDGAVRFVAQSGQGVTYWEQFVSP